MSDSIKQRQFVDILEDGKVGIAVLGEDDEFEKFFASRKEIEDFAQENEDLPNEILESMLNSQAELDNAKRAPSVSGAEAMYLIAARHVELANKLAAGEKPTPEFFSDLAEKDAADLAKLNEQQIGKVEEDIELAKSLSPAYAAILNNGGASVTKAQPNALLDDSELEDIRRKIAAANTTEVEQKRSAEKSNGLVVARSGSELPKGLFIIPPSIEKDYLEKDGAFFSKKDNRLMFHESKEGNSLHTNHKDEKSIADMLEVARAKQWSSIALQGSKEFRRTAWLAAESSGIKATGYSPTKEDLSLLQAKIKEQPLNSISNADGVEKTAPRSQAESSQALVATDAKLNLTKHALALSAQPAFKDRDHAELVKIAEVRALLDEEMRVAGKSDTDRGDYLAKFDRTMEEPKNLLQIEKAAKVERDQALPPPSKQRSVEAELSR